MNNLGKALKTTTLAVIFVGLGAMGSQDAVDETAGDPTAMQKVDDFKSIRITGKFKGTIEVNGEQGVSLVGDGDLLEKVQTRVKDEELQIKYVKSHHHHRSIVINVSAKTLEKITIDGAGQFKVKGIDNDDFKLKLPGAAALDLSGTCKDLEISIAGAATIDAKELKCNNADIKISGSGNLSIYADEKVEARISGMGHIDVYGDPQDVKKKVSGLGRIKLK